MRTSAPHFKFARGGTASIPAAEDITQNMFTPIDTHLGIPNANVNFITAPQIQHGHGAPPPPSSQPQQQPDGMQQIAEGTQAANGLTGTYKGIKSADGILAGTGSNPSLTGSIWSGINGNGFGGILGGPNAQSALANSTNGFAPGMSLDALGSGATTVPESAVGVGTAIDASAADAAATAATAATADAAATTAAASAPEWLTALLAFFNQGGAVPSRADGGSVQKETYHHSGLLNSAGPGRTDTINTTVPAGSYVIPADIVSGLGEGSTLAGSAVIDRMFATAPYGVNPPRIGHGRGVPTARTPEPVNPDARPSTVDSTFINSAGRYAKGGDTEKSPVVVAGGEHVLSPQQIIAKFGSLRRGHQILDHWVVMQRQKIAKEIKSLPNPVGSKVRK